MNRSISRSSAVLQNSVDRSEDTIYADDEFLLVETLLGITGTAVGGGAEIYGDHVNPASALDDLFIEDGPSGETLLTAIKALEPPAIAEMVNRSGPASFFLDTTRERALSS